MKKSIPFSTSKKNSKSASSGKSKMPKTNPTLQGVKTPEEKPLTDLWKSRFEAVAGLSNEVIYILDIATGNINWTGSTMNVLGLSKKKLTEGIKAVNTIIHPEDAEKVIKLRNKVQRTGGKYNVGYKIKKGKSNFLNVMESGVVVKGKNKKSGQIIARISSSVAENKESQNSHWSNSEFQMMVNELPLFIYHINRKGEITFSNKAYAALFNLSPKSLLGKTSFDLHPKHMAEKYKRDDNKVFRKGKTFFTVEENVNKITGKKEVVEVFKIPLRDGGGKITGLMGVFWSISDLVAVQKELRNVESNYKEIFNATGEAIFIHNAETGEILEVNDTAPKMYGYTRDELLKLSIQDLSSGDAYYNNETAGRMFERSSEKDGLTFEWRARNKKGKLFWVEVSLRKSKIGGKGRVLAVVRDITKRKDDERALFLSQMSINYSREAVIWFNKEGLILFANAAAFELLKYSRKEIYSLYINNIENNPEEGFWDARLRKINSAGSIMLNTSLADKKKMLIPVEMSMSYYRYEKDEFVFSIIRDISERKIAEEKLRESEKKYRDMTELLPQGVFECDLTGKVTYANKKLFELLQRTLEDLEKGFFVTDSLIEEDRHRAVKNIRAVLEKKPRKFEEYKMLRKDGTTFPVSIFSDIFWKGNQPAGLRGIIVDLTERVAREEEKREHDNLFSLLFEKAGDANLLIEGNKFIDCNETTVKVLRAKNKQDVIQKFPWEISPEYQPDGLKSSDKAEKLIETAFREGSQRFEWTHLRFDGTEFYVEVVLTAIPIKGKWFLHTTWRDITDKKLAEAKEKLFYKRLEELLEIERKILSAQSSEKIAKAALKHLREILDCQRASVILFDNTKDLFTIIAVNSSINTVLTPGTSYVLSQSPISYLREGDVEIIDDMAVIDNLSPVDRILLKEGIRSRISLPLIINNKVEGTLNLSSVDPMNFSEEKIKIAQEVSVSISLALQHSNLIDRINRQNLELEKKVDERTARLKETINELESFSYSVSHDLRAPLRSIGGFSQALIDDYSDKLGDDGNFLLNRIISASQKMSDLIDALLLLARITRSEMTVEPVDLSALFASVAEDIQKQDPERKAEIIIQPNLTAAGDQKLLRIAIENLLSNAWKFTRGEEKALIEFGETKIDGNRVFFIRDNGVGFDMAYVNKLFGAFQRLHSVEEFEGTGVGLATTKRIMLRHNGSIWAESFVNKGTTFYFTIKI